MNLITTQKIINIYSQDINKELGFIYDYMDGACFTLNSFKELLNDNKEGVNYTNGQKCK